MIHYNSQADCKVHSLYIQIRNNYLVVNYLIERNIDIMIKRRKNQTIYKIHNILLCKCNSKINNIKFKINNI